MLGLSPVWNCYPKGCHNTLITKRSIIARDESENKTNKTVSEYILGLLRRFPLLELIQQESITKRLFYVTSQFDPHLVYSLDPKGYFWSEVTVDFH